MSRRYHPVTVTPVVRMGGRQRRVRRRVRVVHRRGRREPPGRGVWVRYRGVRGRQRGWKDERRRLARAGLFGEARPTAQMLAGVERALEEASADVRKAATLAKLDQSSTNHGQTLNLDGVPEYQIGDFDENGNYLADDNRWYYQ